MPKVSLLPKTFCCAIHDLSMSGKTIVYWLGLHWLGSSPGFSYTQHQSKELKHYDTCVSACDLVLKHKSDHTIEQWRDQCFSLLPPPPPTLPSLPSLAPVAFRVGESSTANFAFDWANVLMGVDESHPSGVEYSKFGLSGTWSEELSLPPSTLRKLRIANRETRTMLLLLLTTSVLIGCCWYHAICRSSTKTTRMTQ